MAGGAQQGSGGSQTPSINPQTISDLQTLLQYYQQNRGQFGGMGGMGMGQPSRMQGGQPPQASGQGAPASGFLQGGAPPQAPPQASFGQFNTRPMQAPQQPMRIPMPDDRAPQQFTTAIGLMDASGNDVSPMRPPLQGAPVAGFGSSPIGGNPPPVQNTGGPDMTGNAPSASFGFDRSGSDAGVGGSPVTQVQSPYQPSNPPLMSSFRPQQGLQIQGNPTERQFQPRRPRSSGGMFG